ncbi:MAG: hypothetical protein ACI8QC_002784 [Planctomycetota bacterium]
MSSFKRWSQPRPFWAAAAIAIWLLAGAYAAPQVGQASNDPHAEWKARLVEDGRKVSLEDVSGNDCLRCHAVIGEEWRHSTHASAWQDEHYKQALKKIRRKKGCWGCHAPEPLAAAGYPQSPKVREERRHLGVDCIACHLGADGKSMLGPAGHPNSAHPSEAAEVFDDSASDALCIACHATSIGPVIGIAKDYVETNQADLGQTCVSCHMPRVRRPWAEPWEADQEPFPTRRGRSHRLNTARDPEFLATAFELAIESTDSGSALLLTNLTGHRVPGLQKRELSFELEVLDTAGKTLKEITRTFDYRAFLPVEGEVLIPLPAQGTRLVVRGLHTPPGAKKAQTFLDRSFEF